MLLDLIDLQITYRSRTLIGVALAPVRDMALLDPFNPRSVAFQANLIDEHIGALPVLRQDGIPEEPRRLSTLLRAELAAEYADRLDDSRHPRHRAAADGPRRGDRDALLPAGRRAGRARKKSRASRDLRRHASHALSLRRAVAVNVCVLRLLPRSKPRPARARRRTSK